MGRVISIALKSWILLFSTVFLLAHDNTHAIEKISLNGSEISVNYHRPSLNGRSIEQLLGKLGPDGVWRLGADQVTRFVTTGDLSFVNGELGTILVPRGKYVLWVRRGADGTWELLFNGNTEKEGRRYNPASDVAAVPLQQDGIGGTVEVLTIDLSGSMGAGKLAIHWGGLSLLANFKLD